MPKSCISNSILDKIHNAALARHLAGFQPPISLNEDNINHINKTLEAHDINFAEDAHYQILLNTLSKECKIKEANKQNFHEYFKKTDPIDIRRNIQEQYQFNHNLLIALHEPNLSNADRNLLTLLLRIEKKTPIKNLEEVRTAFFNNPTWADFLADRAVSPLKEALANKLSKEEFIAIRTAHTQELFDNSSDLQETLTQLNRLQSQLNSHTAIINELYNHAKSVTELENNLGGFYTLALRGESLQNIKKLREQYNNLQEQYLNTLTYLEQINQELELLDLDKVSINRSFGDAKTWERCEQQRKKLTENTLKQADKIKQSIDYYQMAIKKLPIILNEIRGEYHDSKRLIFKPENVVIYYAPRSTPNQQNTIISQGTVPGDGDLAVFERNKSEDFFTVIDKSRANQVISFDGSYTLQIPSPVPGKNSEEKAFQWSFTYDAHPPRSLSSYYNFTKGERVNPGKYEITQFPSIPANTPLTKSEKEKFFDAKIQFAMTMATQIIGNLIKAPTKEHPLQLSGIPGKEQELRYIWTALVFIGQNNTNMPFQPDALKIQGNVNFDPKQEWNAGLFGINKGFTEYSLFHQVFKRREIFINKYYIDELNNLGTTKKYDRKITRTIDKQVQQAMKHDIQTTREKIEKRARISSPEKKEPSTLDPVEDKGAKISI